MPSISNSESVERAASLAERAGLAVSETVVGRLIVFGQHRRLPPGITDILREREPNQQQLPLLTEERRQVEVAMSDELITAALAADLLLVALPWLRRKLSALRTIPVFNPYFPGEPPMRFFYLSDVVSWAVRNADDVSRAQSRRRPDVDYSLPEDRDV